MENRDVNGFVQGKYGFVDPNGELHEIGNKNNQTLKAHNIIYTQFYCVDYVAGNTLGFQSRNGQSPSTSQWPVVHTASQSSSQRAQDFEYSSVDDDHDGIPDNLQGNIRLTSVGVPQTASHIVNVAPTRLQSSSQLVNVAPITTTNTQNVVRVVETAPAAVQTPFTVGGYSANNVRLTVQQPAPLVASNVRLTSAPLQQQIQYQQQSVVPNSFVVQEHQQPIFTNFGGHQQLGGFIRNVQQPGFTNVIRNTNTYGGHQQLRGGVRFGNTLLGNTGY